MSKAPPIPREQRTYVDRQGKAAMKGSTQGRRDEITGLQSAQPGDRDVNLAEQGRHGNIRQNIRPQWRTQDR
jgi:hypothetical protein